MNAPVAVDLDELAKAQAFTAAHRCAKHHNPHELMTWGESFGKPRCQGLSKGGSMRGGYSQCTNPGKVTLADGSTWCGVHSPDAVEARRVVLAKREADRQEARRLSRRRALDANPYVQALLVIAHGDNDPRATARQALDKVWAELTGEASDGPR